MTGLDDVNESTRWISLPKPTVEYNEITLVKDKDYKISYTTTDTNVTIENDAINFNEPGYCSVTATITGMGDYMGEVAQTFIVKYYDRGVPPSTDEGL